MDSKVALITGAGRGIGRKVALELASGGATVVLTDKNADALDETARLISASLTEEPENKVNEQLICREADVTDLDQIASLCQDVVAHHKRIDILINNAAIAGPTLPVDVNRPWLNPNDVPLALDIDRYNFAVKVISNTDIP